MSLLQVTPPIEEPISVADAMAHLRQSVPDPTIPGFIAAARAACENYMHRVVITQTWQYFRDGWPPFDRSYVQDGYPEIIVPKPPFQSMNWLKYVDLSGVLQTLVAAGSDGTPPVGAFWGYQLDPGGRTAPARLTPPYAVPWPPVRRIPNNVSMEFVCGYGAHGPDPNAPAETTPATVWIGQPIPSDIVNGLKMQLAWLYKFRGDDVTANVDPDGLAPGVAGLLKQYRNLVS